MDDNNGTRTICVDNDDNDGNGRDGKGDGNDNRDGNADDAAAVDGKDVDEADGSNSRMAIGRQQLDVNNGTTTMCLNKDGDDGNGGEDNGNGNRNGKGNSNDAAAAAVGNTVNEDECSDSRTAIG